MEMSGDELEMYILEKYACEADHPWEKNPDNSVFRHRGNRKWFALVMDVAREKLGLEGEGVINVVNVKCDPAISGSLRGMPGFFPAYHMNKENWITIALDGSVDRETVCRMVDMSFEATKRK